MAITINTNLSALNAQRQLNKTQSSLSQALERLSSGKRVNSAKDDAAGLAISTRLEAQIRGQSQAARNAQDGISLAQTAESSLGQISESLQRLRELAIQSANATNSTDDRAALNQEYQQLINEINYVSNNADFNGTGLFDGSFGLKSFQVGEQVGQTIDVFLNSFRAEDVGKHAVANSDFTNSFEASNNDIFDGDADIDGRSNGASFINSGTSVNDSPILAATNVRINDVRIGPSIDYSNSIAGADATSAYSKAKAINDSNIPDVTATAIPNTFISNNTNGFTLNNADDIGDSATLEINDVTVSKISVGETTSKSAEELIADINSVQEQTGVIASRNTAGNVVLTANDGRNIEVTMSGSDSGDEDFTISSPFGTSNSEISDGATSSITFRGKIELYSNHDISIDGSTEQLGFNSSTSKIVADQNNLNDSNIITATASNSAIRTLDKVIDQVSSQRATLGAVQRRFEASISNTLANVVNLEATKSRIVDADFALETSNLTKAQILQQAATSILAQANASQQNVLSLLQ